MTKIAFLCACLLLIPQAARAEPLVGRVIILTNYPPPYSSRDWEATHIGAVAHEYQMTEPTDLQRGIFIRYELEDGSELTFGARKVFVLWRKQCDHFLCIPN